MPYKWADIERTTLIDEIGRFIPAVEGNRDYQEFLASGSTPAPCKTEEELAAESQAAQAKAEIVANLKTVLADYVAKLNTEYPGLNLDAETDTLESATIKILSTDIAATECAALDMIYRQIQNNA